MVQDGTDQAGADCPWATHLHQPVHRLGGQELEGGGLAAAGLVHARVRPLDPGARRQVPARLRLVRGRHQGRRSVLHAHPCADR
eukprot:13864179-Alexandrium_andersonii.AAC.1